MIQRSDIAQVARRYASAQRASGTYTGWAIGLLGDELLSRSPAELAAEVAAAARDDALRHGHMVSDTIPKSPSPAGQSEGDSAGPLAQKMPSNVELK